MTYRLIVIFVDVNIYRFSFKKQFAFLIEQLIKFFYFFIILYIIRLKVGLIFKKAYNFFIFRRIHTMAKKKGLTAAYDALPKLLKLILQLFFGYPIAVIYRIVKFVEKGNIITLITGIVLIFGFGAIAWVIDFITVLLSNKITVLAD